MTFISPETKRLAEDEVFMAKVKKAVGRFQTRIDTKYRPLLQVVVRDRNLKVVPHPSISATDGTTVNLRVPLELGEDTEHTKHLCGVRDEKSLRMLCPACFITDDVDAVVFHESAHIVHKSFTLAREGVKRAAYEKLLLPRVKSTNPAHEAAVREQIMKSRTAMEIANKVDLYLPHAFNVVEDIYVNEKLFEARPGIQLPMKAHQRTAILESWSNVDGSTNSWQTAPISGRAMTAFYLEGAGHTDLIEELNVDGDLDAIIGDPDFKSLVSRIAGCKSTTDRLALSIEVLDLMRKHGCCIDSRSLIFVEFKPPKPPKPPTPPKAEDDDEDKDDEDANDEDGDQGEPCEDGSAGESSEDGTDTDEESGSSASDEADADDDADQEAQPEPGDPSEDGDPDEGEGEGHDEPEEAGDGEDGDEDSETDEDDEDGSAGDADADQGGDEGEDEDAQETGSSSDETDEADQGDDDDDFDPEGQDDAGAGSTPDEDEEADDDGDQGDAPDDDEAADDDDDQGGSSADDETDQGDDDEDFGDDEDDEDRGDPGDDDRDDDDEDFDDDDEDFDNDEDGDSETSEVDADDEAEGGKPGEDSDPDLSETHEVTESDADEDSSARDREQEELEAFEMNKRLQATMGHPETGDEDELPAHETPEEQLIDLYLGQKDFFDEPSFNVRTVEHQRIEDLHYDFESVTLEGAPTDGDVSPSLLRLRLAFTENKKKGLRRSLTHGPRLDPAHLYRVGLDDPRIFGKRDLPNKRDWVVSITLDCSGSTAGRRIDAIKKGGYAMAELLHRLGIPFQLSGHTGYGELVIIPIKDLKEPWNNDTRKRCMALEGMDANLDGHTLEYHRRIIQGHTATDKLILYFTDGQMPLENYEEELVILQRNIAICQKLGIRLVGVGVGTDSPKAHGLDTIRYDNLSMLPNLISELTKRLLV